MLSREKVGINSLEQWILPDPLKEKLICFRVLTYDFFFLRLEIFSH